MANVKRAEACAPALSILSQLQPSDSFLDALPLFFHGKNLQRLLRPLRGFSGYSSQSGIEATHSSASVCAASLSAIRYSSRFS